MGTAYQKLGGAENSKKGLDLQEQALIMQKILHANQPHSDVALSLSNLSSTYQNLGGVENSKKSLVLQEQALAMWQILYGNQPRLEIVGSLYRIGCIYISLGESIRGLTLITQSTEMQKEIGLPE